MNCLHLLQKQVLQASWNLLPFLPGIIAAIVLRGQVKDKALLRALFAVSAGALLVFLTIIKNGAYINLVVVAEPLLLTLAATGAYLLWQKRGRLLAKSLIVSSLLLLFLQSGSLLLNPASPTFFAYPMSGSTHGWQMSPRQVDAEVKQVQLCPEDQAYSGFPYIAFESKRRMPGNQGDLFILNQGDTFKDLRLGAKKDRPLCP